MNCGICHKQTDLWEDGGVLCEDCVDKPRYRYYSTLRPPGTFAVPDGVILREIWGRVRTVHGTSIRAHGWVEYPEPLDFEKVWRFDLLPADEEELKVYSEWSRREMG
jgi:hypothetical protein